MFRIRRSIGVGGALASLLVLGLLIGPGLGSPIPSGPASVPGSPMATTPPLIYHAALYSNNSPPAGATTSGEVVGAEFRVVAPAYPASAGPATVRVPSTLVTLPTTQGGVHLYFSALNITLNGSNLSTRMAGPASRFGSPLQFNATPAAFLSSQGVAVMASWAPGAYSILFRWQWLLEAPDGSIHYGPWSNATSVTPAEILDLSIPGGTTWTIGRSNPACVVGPIAGRTVSAHLSTSNPSTVLVTGTVTVPPGQNGSFCWDNSVSSGIPPQTAYLHLWEYSNLTYELDVIQVQLVDPSSPGGGSGGSGGGASWIPYVVLGGIAFGVLVALEVAYLLSPQTVVRLTPRRLRRTDPAALPPPGADPATSGIAGGNLSNDPWH